MVVALELDDLVTARIPPRDPDRAHGRFRAGRDEPHLVHTRHRTANCLCQLDFQRSGSAERRASTELLLNSVDDLWMRVSQQQRPPRPDAVQIAVAVGIVEIRAFTPLDKQRFAAHRPKRAHRRIHAAGDHSGRCVEQFPRFCSIHSMSLDDKWVLNVSTQWKVILMREERRCGKGALQSVTRVRQGLWKFLHQSARRRNAKASAVRKFLPSSPALLPAREKGASA